MAQVHVALDRKALGILVGEDSAAGRLGFADNALGSRLVEEAVVDTAGPPGIDALSATDAFFTDKGMSPAIVVAGIVVGTVVVFLFLERVR